MRNIVWVALCAALVSAPAMAEKLEISGELTTSTCQVSTIGGAVTVPMGRVDLTGVNAAERAGQKNFTVSLDCTGSGSSQEVGIRFGGTPYGSTGYLALTGGATAATNVGVAIYDAEGRLQKIGDDPASFVTVPASSKQDLRFSAWYASPGRNATAGTADATGDFVVIYK